MFRRTMLIVWILAAVTLAGCAQPAAQGSAPGTTAPAAKGSATTTAPVSAAPEGKGSVSRALTAEPTSLDPHGAAGAGQNVLLPYLFDTLVYRDLDNSYKPFLAESWDTAPDGKMLTFKLRSDVKFHDGSPLSAEAVVFTFQRFKEKGSRSPIYSGISQISNVEAVDSRTVRFSFDKPSTTFLGTISMPYAGIMSLAAREAGDAIARKPMGSGPFMLEGWQQGVSVTLVRNPDYRWGPPAVKNQGSPYVQRMVFKVIPDATSQFNALQAGDVDIIFVNQPGQLQKLKQDKNIQSFEASLSSLVYLGYNTRQAPFDDVRVRQALSHAVNKDEIVQTALGGIGKVAFSPIASTLPAFDPALKQYEQGFDLARAKALLAEAGFKQGAGGTWERDGQPLTLKLLTSTRAPNEAIATVLQAQYKVLGVTAEIQALDSAAAQEAAGKGQYGVMLWRYDWNDADVLNSYLTTERIGGTNRNFYSNKEVDALLAKAITELDTKERTKLYVEAQKLIMQDAVWQPLYSPVDVIAVRDRVQDVVIGPMGRTLMNDAKVK